MRFFLVVPLKCFNFAGTTPILKDNQYGKSNSAFIGSAIQQLP